MEKVVAIDLGSNSFRVLVYDCLNHKIISEFNQVVGMADGLVDTGNISKEAQERVVEAISYSSEKLNYNPKEAVCVTTAAMRMANNSNEVLQYFLRKTGAKFKIIDGKEEARLTLLAVKYALKREKLKSEKFVLLDIGGGSTEIIVNTKNDYKAHSFNFGIVTLTQKFDDYKLLEESLNLRKKEISNFINTLQIDLKEYNFVATAGTPTTIAAIKLGQDFFHYDKSLVNGTIVDLNDLNECLELFRNSSKQTITNLVGSGRVEFIEVGVYIYKAIFEALNKKESIVLDDGLREGVAINQCLIK
ncbi:exopolyphosphatase/guanosine-5'-triphosphate,3'-diphosphate pyrophosphatase [Malaciobacter marinus]|uniref:Exopolyphosphatase/guanosine-5'-triphosphate, 3'-diphosphate pyrophosphatase n=1 Tax=Malaciobacter marinus TaxID=505249 RepID=A0AB36ZVW2_9BACT|nr:exopolyphosphatase [Malaciobacter marinus]PPK60783.1 exopolyphosphatase/guanosine-5'-triphosphate,3'-diphosphate pyrophosphatase [Malaciobacter marinus]